MVSIGLRVGVVVLIAVALIVKVVDGWQGCCGRSRIVWFVIGSESTMHFEVDSFAVLSFHFWRAGEATIGRRNSFGWADRR